MAAGLFLDGSRFCYREVVMLIDVVDLEIVSKYQMDIQCVDEYVYGVETAGPIFSKEIGKANVEKFAVLCLDHTNRIINFSIISIGIDENVNASLSQLFKMVLLSNASKILVGHNHPSGILKITKPDITMTQRIGQIASFLGIKLIDSIIVNSSEEFISIRENIGQKENEEQSI